jgi:LmbE family N-acetylglucosaminyl deacetylase
MAIEETLKSLPVVVVAAHPDDETIGAAGVLPWMRNPYVVHVTDGSPRNLADARAAGYDTREAYARARRQEALAALGLAGVDPTRTCTLQVPDQEASVNMAFISMRLGVIIRDLKPAIVLTHPYEGGHPDHDAVAFAVHAACARSNNPPAIYEFTSYHAKNAGASTGGAALEAGCFLAGEDSGEEVPLIGPSREYKRRMFDCFTTQQQMLQQFPMDVERFRESPVYDFAEPPHRGTLFYEHFSWGVTGALWRRLAKQAAHALGSPCII